MLLIYRADCFIRALNWVDELILNLYCIIEEYDFPQNLTDQSILYYQLAQNYYL